MSLDIMSHPRRVRDVSCASVLLAIEVSKNGSLKLAAIVAATATALSDIRRHFGPLRVSKFALSRALSLRESKQREARSGEVLRRLPQRRPRQPVRGLVGHPGNALPSSARDTVSSASAREIGTT